MPVPNSAGAIRKHGPKKGGKKGGGRAKGGKKPTGGEVPRPATGSSSDAGPPTGGGALGGTAGDGGDGGEEETHREAKVGEGAAPTVDDLVREFPEGAEA